jgi:hypothetical protein
VLSHQDGCCSAVALFLKAALIQVSNYRLLGASDLIRGIQWLFYQSLVPIEQLKGSRQEDIYVNFP